VWSAVDDVLPPAGPLRVTTEDIVCVVRGIHVKRVAADFSGVRPSAVLVLLADDADGNAGVLLTRRSTALRNHSGEICFPGGRIDPGETEIHAALREANEEVGLDPAMVDVVGELDQLATVVSRSHIVPIVGRVPAQLVLAPASAEVERVLWVPLGEFVRADTYRAERWTVPAGASSAQERVLHFFELDDETVWGATAHILVDLLNRLR
jgi:8-oxo-dGTP pyrophosphatase MutT (NUDIX family)